MVYEVEKMDKGVVGGHPPQTGGIGGPPPIAFAISLRVLAGALVFKLKKRGDGTVTWVPWGP